MDYKTANIKPDARSDVRIRGFWTRYRNAFFDTRIVYPFASSYLSKSPVDVYKMASNSKKRAYGQRIRNVEGADFTPLIMTSSCGMGPEMNRAIKHLALKISEKTKRILFDGDLHVKV